MRQSVVSFTKRLLGGQYATIRSVLLGEPRVLPPRALARRILKSGIFDAEYFAAVSGSASTSQRRLAREWVDRGAKDDLPIHPLVEVDYVPTWIRLATRAGRAQVLLAYLASNGDSRTHAWGPLFDPRLVPDGHDPLDALRSLRPDSMLPLGRSHREIQRSWGELRAHLIEVVANAASQQAHSAINVTTRWNDAAEREWTASVSPLPEAVARQPTDRPQPVVSVIMPAWNRADAIATAIESVRSQTYPQWQLVVVDDGSIDETVAIARKLADFDERIVVIAAPHEGVSAARNRAIDAATGEYLAFLDTDNSWTERFLELSMAGIRNGNNALVYSAVELVDDERTSRFRGAQVSLDDLLIDNSIDVNCLVVLTSLVREIGGFDTSIRRWVDHDLVLRLARKTPPHYLPFVGCLYRDLARTDRIGRSESRHWQFVVLGKAMVDWPAVANGVPHRVTGRTSVVMLAYQDHQRTIASVNSVLATTPGSDLEIVLIDNGSRLSVGRVLAARFADEPRVRYVRLARNYNFAIGCNVGFAQSTGGTVMFLNNDTIVRDQWHDRLLGRLSGSDAIAVQPLLVYPSGAIQTAGTVFPVSQGLACHFLPRHPIADAQRHDGKGFSAVTAGAMMIRAKDFAKLSGFDPLFVNGLEDVDFCLRVSAALGGSFEVVSDAIVVHEESASPGRFLSDAENRRLFLERWKGRLPGPESHQFAKIGLAVVHTTPETDQATGMARPLLARPSRSVARGRTNSPPSLRWAIKIGADFSPEGDKWGDVPFADDLGEALTELGQEVVVDRRDAFGRSSVYLDDVVLAIRGAMPVLPQAGRINVLWVISRPETVTVDEVLGFDLVFAASPQWAEWMTAASGRDVRVLLQATNPRRFAPEGAVADVDDRTVFVGGPRPPIGRRIVADVNAAGLPFGVWGPGWERFVDLAHVRGSFLPHDEAASVYRRADIVLNDHLPGMAEWGFVSNRIFDAVACGSSVITDPIAGIEKLFGNAVRSYESIDELRELVTHRERIFPAKPQRIQLAKRIGREHSFANRAETLFAAVLNVTSNRQSVT